MAAGNIKKTCANGFDLNVLNLYLNYIRPKVTTFGKWDELNDKQGKKIKKKSNGCGNNLGPNNVRSPV